MILTNVRPQKQFDSFFFFRFADLGLGRIRPPFNPPEAQPAPRPARRRSRDQKRSHEFRYGILPNKTILQGTEKTSRPMITHGSSNCAPPIPRDSKAV